MDSGQTCWEPSPEATGTGQLFPCFHPILQPCSTGGSSRGAEPRAPAGCAGWCCRATLLGLLWGFPPQDTDCSFHSLRDKYCRGFGATCLGSTDFTFGANLKTASFPKVSIRPFQGCWSWIIRIGIISAQVLWSLFWKGFVRCRNSWAIFVNIRSVLVSTKCLLAFLHIRKSLCLKDL